jgi:hypothetical protein
MYTLKLNGRFNVLKEIKYNLSIIHENDIGLLEKFASFTFRFISWLLQYLRKLYI